MDLQQQRMECLKMAFELGGKTDPIVGAAQQLLDFVAGKQAQPIVEEVAKPTPTLVPLAEEQAASTAPENVAETPSPDVIAACGTVLVLPESGDLPMRFQAPKSSNRRRRPRLKLKRQRHQSKPLPKLGLL